MTEQVEVTQVDREYVAGWTNNPEAIAVAKCVADRCSKLKPNGEPKAPHRYAMIYQAAGMGAHQVQSTAAAQAELLEALEDLCDFSTECTQDKWDRAREIIASVRGGME